MKTINNVIFDVVFLLFKMILSKLCILFTTKTYLKNKKKNILHAFYF